MNIQTPSLFNRLQRLVSSLLVKGNNGAVQTMENAPAESSQAITDPVADVAWPAITYMNRPKRIRPNATDVEKDNFLRGDLIPEQRRRRTTNTDRVAISYWRHGTNCPCCQKVTRPQDYHQVAPASAAHSKKLNNELKRNTYLDMNNPGMGMELSNLSSFITESGKYTTYTPEPSPKPVRNPASVTLTNLASQIQMVADTLSQLAQDEDPVVRAMAAVNPRTPIDVLQVLINDESEDVRTKASQNITNQGLNLAA